MRDQDTEKKDSPREVFKGLSVRAEYGDYRFDQEDQDSEGHDHGTLETRRTIRVKKPTKHIAQGLHW